MSVDHRTIPTIARVLEDRTIIELIHDQVARETALAVSTPDGATRIERVVELPSAERLAPWLICQRKLPSQGTKTSPTKTAAPASLKIGPQRLGHAHDVWPRAHVFHREHSP